MEPKFWHERWEENKTAFHLSEPNPQLVKNLKHLQLKHGDRVFVPLCGKSVDMPWLAAQGFKVVGAELSRIAIDQFFKNLQVTPAIAEVGNNLLKFSAGPIEIFVGNIFDLTEETLGPVNAIYDRAALVALPQQMRQDYSAHLLRISKVAKQLIVTYEYDQSKMDGPPFSVVSSEVRKLYGRDYQLSEVERFSIDDGLKGVVAAIEVVWLAD